MTNENNHEETSFWTLEWKLAVIFGVVGIPVMFSIANSFYNFGWTIPNSITLFIGLVGFLGLFYNNFNSDKRLKTQIKKQENNLTTQIESQKENLTKQLSAQEEHVMIQVEHQEENLFNQLKKQEENLEIQLSAQRYNLDKQLNWNDRKNSLLKMYKDIINEFNLSFHSNLEEYEAVGNSDMIAYLYAPNLYNIIPVLYNGDINSINLFLEGFKTHVIENLVNDVENYINLPENTKKILNNYINTIKSEEFNQLLEPEYHFKSRELVIGILNSINDELDLKDYNN